MYSFCVSYCLINIYRRIADCELNHLVYDKHDTDCVVKVTDSLLLVYNKINYNKTYYQKKIKIDKTIGVINNREGVDRKYNDVSRAMSYCIDVT